MTVKNKWNNGFYELVEKTDRTATLKVLTDKYGKHKGDTFTIAISEYFFSYSEKILDILF